MKHESLTIHLAKVGNEAPAATIKELASLTAFQVTDDAGPLGTLYVQARKANPPSWGDFFETQVARAALGKVSSTAGILHVVVDKRAFLITFGQGRHLIEHGTCEERFGLIVTLNSIASNQIRSIDKHTLDTVGVLSRVQSSREAAPSDFGIDVERDLLRAITGRPKDKTLGRVMSGFDTLHVNVEVSLGTLRDLLSRYLHQYGLNDYKTTFPWVEHISPVRDAILMAALDKAMLAHIVTGQADKCWLAVPDPIDWGDIAGFRYGGAQKFARYHDIEMATFLSENGIEPQDVTLDNLRKKRVQAVDGNDGEKVAWSAYECVYAEVDHPGGTYLLSKSLWYRVDTNFVARVNDAFKALPRYPVQLPEYKDASEGTYSERVAAENAASYSLLDKKLIKIPVGRSKVEVCDLFAHNGDMIHIKHYGSSHVLSHLFAQGVVAGELFVSDGAFRQDVNKLLPAQCQLANPQLRLDTGHYKIVYAVISSQPAGKFDMPFFSRLTLRNAAQTLSNYGYKVELAKISMDAAFLKTKKLKAPRGKSK